MARARATCLCCRAVLPPDRVRSQLAAQRGGADAAFGQDRGNRVGGARMTAVVTLRPGEKGRHYRLPTDADYTAVRKAQERVKDLLDEWERDGRQGLCPVPDEPLPPIGTLGFRVQRYGMLQWGRPVHGAAEGGVGGAGTGTEYASQSNRLICLCMMLALSALSRLADKNDFSSLYCELDWTGKRLRQRTSIVRHFPLVWDFR